MHNMTFSYGEMNLTFNKNKKIMAEKIRNLEEYMRPLPQYEAPTEEYLHAGMYCRKVFREKGVWIVGKVHKKEHFYMVMCGTVLITTDEGVREVTGPCIFKSTPGTKRVVFAVTDATCATVHCTDRESIEGIEDDLVISDPLDMIGVGNKLKHEVLT